MAAWEPSAPWSSLRRRAALLAAVRGFFAQRQVLEVETPLLATAPVTDPQLEALSLSAPGLPAPMYLQTSPEYAMKRLLAAGSGPIYQLCKAFRRDERGRHHNPEFTLLEWYRPGFDADAMAAETLELVALALGPRPQRKVTYRESFLDILGLDPFDASLAEIQAVARDRLDVGFESECRDVWLQLLHAACVEPHLGREEFTVMHDFPASQAALARLRRDAGGRTVAARFEVFVEGVELANGYEELADPDEQAARFAADLERRRGAGQELPPIDQHLLAALRHGLPACSGVALGFDRLVMLACAAGHIDAVLAFPLERA